MRLATLLSRNLTHFWRSHLAVALGVVAGAAALTGALLVGDSMRGSLRALALSRLAGVEQALVSARFFREALADSLADSAGTRVEPLILMRGAASHADTRRLAGRVNVLGVRRSFWSLDGVDRKNPLDADDRFSVVINAALAEQIGAGEGDDVLLRLGKPAAISSETLFGRRDDAARTLRLKVRAVIPQNGPGAFALGARQAEPANAFLPLATLQRALEQPGRANALLAPQSASGAAAGQAAAEALQRSLAQCATLADYGLKLRASEPLRYFALESDALLIEPPIEQAARDAARSIGAESAAVMSYLANELRLDSGAMSDDGASGARGATVPYSTVAAIAPHEFILGQLETAAAASATLAPGEILLNEWAAADLGARVGDRIRMTYYVTGPRGRLDTAEQSFALRGVTRLTGAGADPGFVPEYPGITDARGMSDWDPPFPIDLKRVRDKDERYWDEHRTAPKAFITLADGRAMWAERGERFGRLTGLRLRWPTPSERNLADLEREFEAALLSRVAPQRLGLRFEPVRERALAAGAGSTDFAALSLGFSFFLIVSAAMLVALLFRLGVELRAAEIGALRAMGFAPRRILRILLSEGAVVACAGSALGAGLAVGYAWLMLAGLRGWWSEAANAPFLRLHIEPASLAAGFLSSFLIALVSIASALRGLARQSPRALLAGAVQAGAALPGAPSEPRPSGSDQAAGVALNRNPMAAAKSRRGRLRSSGRLRSTSGRLRPTSGRLRSTSGPGRVAAAVALGASGGAAALVIAALTGAIAQTGAFFGGGALTLAACLALARRQLARAPRHIVRQAGLAGAARLGVRNAPRHLGRSMLTIGLIASASFLIGALSAFNLAPDTGGRNSGSGGFALIAEAAAPLTYDLGSPQGRAELGLDAQAEQDVAGVEVFAFRLRDGDESSCLNLYKPVEPRLVGAPRELIERGGFRFSQILAGVADPANPWKALEASLPEGAIPVIGDEAAVLWQLHAGLGKSLAITDERGRTAELVFVALLSGSALQDELIVSDKSFERLFPSVDGRAFFLIDTGKAAPARVSAALERSLAEYGFDGASSAARIRAYLAVQNTYLSTFQTLGGFGLALGAVGLVAVMLRNVLERRRELALLRAVGFQRRLIGVLVIAENAALVLAGLLAGLIAALVAVAPAALSRPATIPWLSLGLTLAAALAVSLGCGALALRSTLRGPILSALRAE